MTSFCRNSLIWDPYESWNTSDPNLSPCIRDAIVPSVSCGFLWLSVPFWYIWLATYQPKLKGKVHKGSWKDRLTLLFMTKSALSIVVISNLIGELIWRTYQSENGILDLFGSDIFYPIILLITVILAVFMTMIEKTYMIRSSAPLSIFWPLLTVTILPNFKFEIENILERMDSSRIALTVTLLPLCILLSICQLWADVADLEPIEDEVAPNNTNSFYSSVFLSWLTPLIWKGYR